MGMSKNGTALFCSLTVKLFLYPEFLENYLRERERGGGEGLRVIRYKRKVSKTKV